MLGCRVRFSSLQSPWYTNHISSSFDAARRLYLYHLVQNLHGASYSAIGSLLDRTHAKLNENNENRRFEFDHIGVSSLVRDIQLERASQVSLKTLHIPEDMKEKLELMLNQFGHKDGLEQLARHIEQYENHKKQLEGPRVLPNSENAHILEAVADIDDTAKDTALWRTAQQMRLGGTQETWCPSTAEPHHSPKGHKILNQDPANKREALQDAISLSEKGKIDFFMSKRLPFTPEVAVAYTALTLPGHYATHFRILSEVRTRVPGFSPHRLLEYGAKHGAGIMAARNVWLSCLSSTKKGTNDKGNFFSFVAVEPSLHLAKIGDFLTSNWSTRIVWRGRFDDYREARFRERQDLIISSFALTDLSHLEDRKNLIRNLWNQLLPGGVLSIVEAGTPGGFRLIHEVRELFVAELGFGKFHFVAPCPHESACPMASSTVDWCRFSQKYQKLPKYFFNIGPENLTYGTILVSFLVIRKGPGPRQVCNSEQETSSVEDRSYFWPRVIAAPQKKLKQCILQLCMPTGQVKRTVISAHTPRQFGYISATRAMWGDLFRYFKTTMLKDQRLKI